MKKLILASALLAVGVASAADENNSTVQVSSVKNADMRSYRGIVAGLDAFDENHALAPAVPAVRFQLTAQRNQTLDASTLSLRIAGDTDSVAIPIAADGTFIVPRVQWALDENADLVLNRKKDELKGRAVVRTPGLPDNVRRLGDLRLECAVNVAIIKTEVNFIARAALSTLLLTSDWCKAKGGQFSFSPPGVLVNAVIVDGEKRATLNYDADSFLAPLGDRLWSDDARIELTLEPELTAEQKAQPWLAPLYVMGSMNHWAARDRLRRTDDGLFKAELPLKAGRYEFKIGGSQFVGIDLGGNGKDKQTITQETPTTLGKQGGNLILNIDQEGNYAFLLDATNKEQPRLTVTHLQ